MQSLPVDSILPEITESLRRSPNLVLEAPPGAGKTTRVPPALLDQGLAGDGEICILEPRRLAARLAARRVAEERGERLGETVGYQVRFDDVSGPRTRLRFVTEGVLTRRLLSDPQLSKVSVVVLDEFHERHLQADLTLALLRRLQRESRPSLRIVAMSATLDAAPIAQFLDQCTVLRSEGRRFDVSIKHLPREDERPLAMQVEAALRVLLADGLHGDVLVFLPGAAEIRRAQEACAHLSSKADLLILPLHGELPAAEQDRAVRPAEKRKVILSTNVAETSVTIDGVVAVIDSGLARIAGHSPWSGLPRLNVARISQAAAMQRAGRAGRTQPGVCLRLYTAQDLAARAAHETPELQRLDLAEAALALHAAGIRDLHRFEWFEAPPAPALDAAEALLRRLNALDEHGDVTLTGRRMLRLPLHPRLARMVLEAQGRGVAGAACVIAALISERDIRAGNLLTGPVKKGAKGATVSGPSDLLELLDLFREAESLDLAPARLREMNLDQGAVRAVERVSRQLRRLIEGGKTQDAWSSEELCAGQERELLISILAGYPDRVARRRTFSTNEAKGASAELLLAGGGTASLSPSSVVRQAEFLVAVDAEERREQGKGRSGRGVALVRLASAVEPDWLLDLFSDWLSESSEAVWNERGERVEVYRRLLYDQLVLDESRAIEARGEDVAGVLADAALARGLEAFVEPELIERFLSRVDFTARTFTDARFPVLKMDDVREALVQLCEGKNSFAELSGAIRAGGLLDALRRKLNAEQSRLLARMSPERVTLKSGRQVRVNYENGRPPWLASRLQDFFGMREGPQVAGGRVPVVLHLLAPNGRPVQVTSDLSGFWERDYARVRRELSRRYPRHAWPEDPLKV
ncbi:MAG TPA: ATP-dependent helicase HrpB [Pyrinomonadaceae bacterium]|jgi:ATP-dependent helicase HrpB|nr:ATP-dependent helicase HrpB [Pyrinomonadaceae bacterium]